MTLKDIQNIIKNPKQYVAPVIVFVILFVVGAWLYSFIGEKAKQVASPINTPKEIKDVPSPNNTPKEIKDAPSHISLLPSEIMDKIRSYPLLQQEDAKKYYIGLQVEWELNIVTLNTKDNNSARIASRSKKDWPAVVFTVLLNENKKLGILEEGAPIKVFGKISKIETDIIYLEDVRLVVL